MNKSKSIIFSITGIIIVSLFLIVYTFGYVLVKIKGNENSILSSLISKKVSVAYKEISNTSNGETISPGYEFIKTFTATNDGNVEVNYHIYLDNVENEFIRTQDITYTLYRSELNGTLDASSLSDSDIVASGTFPTTDAYIKFNEEIETPNNYYTYALKISYAKTTESQNEDDGHIFSFRVQLYIDLINPFSDNANLLTYNIINNAMEEKNGTILTATPATTPAKGVSNSIYTSYTDPTSTEGNSINQEEFTSRWYVYGSEFTINKEGYVKLTNPQVGRFGDVVESMRNNYTINPIGYSSEAFARMVMNNEFDTLFKVGSSTSTTNLALGVVTLNKETIIESELSVTTDDYGTSYYYRGTVEDNYVNFAGMCWRIVRIEGDGSTKLILEDFSSECDKDTYTGKWSIGSGNYGYDATSTNTSGNAIYKANYLSPVTDNTSSMVKAFYDFQTINLSGYTEKLKSGNWCLGNTAYTQNKLSPDEIYLFSELYMYDYTLLEDISSNYYSKKTFYYDAYTRLTGTSKDGYNPTLKCNGTKLDKFATVDGVSEEAPMYVSAITADEVAFAGVKYNSYNNDNYLIDNYQSNFWTLSLNNFDGLKDKVLTIVRKRTNVIEVTFNYEYRPVITLKSNTTISKGTGTQTDPYIIN